MSDFRKSCIGSFSDELQALIDYGHDCCARIDDRIYECCQRIREAHDVEVGSYQIALMWKEEQDANAMDAGGSVSAGCSGDDAAAAGRVDNCAGDQLAEGVAPITTELREWASVEVPYKYGHQLTAIADRIDAEHERKVAEVASGWDYWESMHVELPKDADGEYIHEHDKVDWRDHACTWHENATVVAVCNDGCYVMDGAVFHVHKSDIRHHHEPTVEDVLRGVVTLCHNTWKEKSAFEFYDVDDVMKSGNIADFAAKLRLAGDAE